MYPKNVVVGVIGKAPAAGEALTAVEALAATEALVPYKKTIFLNNSRSLRLSGKFLFCGQKSFLCKNGFIFYYLSGLRHTEEGKKSCFSKRFS